MSSTVLTHAEPQGTAQPPATQTSKTLEGTADSDPQPAQKSLIFGEDCSYKLWFDPLKQHEDAVRNTANILFLDPPDDFEAPVGPVWSGGPEAYKGFDFDKYQQKCTPLSNDLNKLRFVSLAGIERYRQALTREIKDGCEFQMTRVRGFLTPSALREYQRASACGRFVDALEGRIDFAAILQETISEACRTNYSPSNCAARFSSENPRITLLEFGWNNCAIRYNVHNSAEGVQTTHLRDELTKQFSGLFKVKKMSCED